MKLQNGGSPHSVGPQLVGDQLEKRSISSWLLILSTVVFSYWLSVDGGGSKARSVVLMLVLQYSNICLSFKHSLIIVLQGQ